MRLNRGGGKREGEREATKATPVAVIFNTLYTLHSSRMRCPTDDYSGTIAHAYRSLPEGIHTYTTSYGNLVVSVLAADGF